MSRAAGRGAGRPPARAQAPVCRWRPLTSRCPWGSAPREGPANWQTPPQAWRERPIFPGVGAREGGLPLRGKLAAPPRVRRSESRRPLDAHSPSPARGKTTNSCNSVSGLIPSCIDLCSPCPCGGEGQQVGVVRAQRNAIHFPSLPTPLPRGERGDGSRALQLRISRRS